MPRRQNRPLARRVLVALAMIGAVSGHGRAATSDRRDVLPLERIAALTDSLSESGSWLAADTFAQRGLTSARVAADDDALATWLLRAARTRLDLGRVAEADSLLREEAALVPEGGGAGEDDLPADRLRARAAAERGDLDEAERQAAVCLAHPDADATDADRVAALHLARDRVDEAESVLDGAAARFGGADPAAAAAFDETRAAIAVARGDWARADSLFTSALESREAMPDVGPDHPSLLRALRGLADLRQRRGAFDDAEKLHRRALAIVQRAGGPDHPTAAGIHNDLGVMLRRAGDYGGAIAEYRESLRIRIAVTGPDDPEVALTMVNLSAVLEAVGESAEGLDLLRRAVRILETVYGEDHSRTAWALSHLAQRERGQGNAERAEQLFARSLAIARRIHGASHPDVASYLLGLAQCRMDRGHLEEAREAYAEAAAIAHETMGDDQADAARYDRELGVVLVQTGRLDEGRAVLERSMGVLERLLGPTHPALVRCLSGLTVAALAEGRTEDAAALAARRVAIAEERFGESGLRGSLVMEAATNAARGRFDEAMDAAERGVRIALVSQDDVIAKLTEREALEHAVVHRRAIAALMAAFAADPQPDEAARARALALVAQAHGRVLDRLAGRRQFLEVRRTSPELDALGAAFRDATDRLAARAGQGARGDAEGYAADMVRLRRDKDDAERALAAASDRFARSADRWRRERDVDADALAGALPAEAALVHYVRFRPFTIGTGAWTAGAASLTAALFSGGKDRYGAFTLTGRGPDADREGASHVAFVDLGEAERVDRLVDAFRRAVEAPRGRSPSTRQEVEWRAASRALYDAVWAPAGVARRARVFVVGTSALHGVDFHALLDADEAPVIETTHVHLLSSGRDLLRPPSGEGGRGGALVVGDPCTDGVPDLCAAGSGPRPRLPAAAEETGEVARVLGREGAPVTLLVGDEATETAVRDRCAERSTVHLATHGFFCGDGVDAGSALDETLAENPLLQCGLMLGRDEENDGLLTAQEVVALDLHGLDCVVLTACDSGLGALAPGEGLLGLRRAFEMAGARTVVMALGRVPDSTTRDLVTRLYDLRRDGRPASDALCAAERERLAVERRSGRLHPARWGSFVAEGDWR